MLNFIANPVIYSTTTFYFYVIISLLNSWNKSQIHWYWYSIQFSPHSANNQQFILMIKTCQLICTNSHTVKFSKVAATALLLFFGIDFIYFFLSCARPLFGCIRLKVYLTYCCCCLNGSPWLPIKSYINGIKFIII